MNANYEAIYCVFLYPPMAYGARGSVVVKALRYWSDGLAIYSRWCNWGFFP